MVLIFGDVVAFGETGRNGQKPDFLKDWSFLLVGAKGTWRCLSCG